VETGHSDRRIACDPNDRRVRLDAGRRTGEGGDAMTATVIIAFMSLVPFQPEPETVCTLGRVDRANTPSSRCLSCHDGSVAPAVTGTAVFPGDHGAHPVSVSYAFAPRGVSIRALGPRDARVVLPAGRVECVTCHEGRGRGPHHTVIPPAELCASCHDK
jgi:hypothetical protein